ncbi:hypothetical protein [Cohnella rhizosphaerae]|uniref:Uncharacterized protein n=1 Tax=Cohnella rhizosphaerae TaxID=1457232 RepID=A0A9X4KWU5_9BACL|nr:hypothetical protein [Cohnella rhizosphaerae]MDG0811816.1 hypothetical protein [Cohnella rhizosphaerae]
MSDRLSRRLIICFVLCAVSLSIFFLIQIANFPLISDDFDLGINGGNFKERLNQLDNPSYARGPFFFVILLNLFFHNDTFEIPHVIIGLMHLLVCTGFILLARKMWSHAHFISIGLMAVYLFINPLTNQSTMWILQSYPIFTLLFGVYAALSIIQYKLTARRSWYYLYCTLASLSILCNEQGLLMLPLYLYVNYYFGSSSYKNKAYAWFKSGLPFFCGLAHSLCDLSNSIKSFF